MESLNKKALVELVAQKTGNTKKDTTDLVDHVFEEIANALLFPGIPISRR